MELEIGEDTTKYGEFVSSYFAWVSLPKQKEKVEKLENITKIKIKREIKRKIRQYENYYQIRSEKSKTKLEKTLKMFIIIL